MSDFETIKNKLLQTQYTWLITGVAGFIGANLLETLLDLNQIVIGLDNFATGTKRNLEDVLKHVPASKHHNFTFHEGDICRMEDCEYAVKGVDFILHQAALGSVPRSISTPTITNETNVGGFLNMLLAAKQQKVRRFVYASSSSVYGDSPILPKSEEHIGNPLSPYAVSKYTNELYAKTFARCYDMETIGLRYFNIFGPRQNPNGPYAAVIPLWITSLINEMPVFINGDGETSRDFCYIDNAVQANILAACAERKSAINQVYNVTVGEQTTLNKLYSLISHNLGLNDIKPVYREFRSGDIRHSLADIRKAEQLLHYAPTMSVEKGLEQTIAWFTKS